MRVVVFGTLRGSRAPRVAGSAAALAWLVLAAPALAADEPARIAGEALSAGGAYEFVRSLADGVGHRAAGSPGAERATAWAEAALRKLGAQNVRREPVTVPVWLRGEESAELLAPAPHRLVISTLGGSVGTPAAGITADVIEARSLEALQALGAAAVRGKIVLVNQPMERTSDMRGYGTAVTVRGRAASEAAKLGALAALVRSAGTGYHRLAHTGALNYAEGVAKIPAAALAAEDADLVHRMIAAGAPVRLRLRLGAHAAPATKGWNVVGDVPGGAAAGEIVLIGAHLDSWDVGQGALDDGAGCAMVLDTARILALPGLRPRRTVRVVLYTGEEMAGPGALAYAKAHDAELGRYVAALEADSGAGRPTGYHVAGNAAALALVTAWVQPLAHLVASEVQSVPRSGTDILPLQKKGVPVLGVSQDMSGYFDWHHTQGDTVDKIDPLDLGLATAAFANLTWAAANATDRLPPSPPPP
jgi:hypothetical protein